ncbi:hypothetical protein KKP04_04740 [Rhodomicrobium sp. Az07]|uniref:glycoside hydrolase family 3 N-terminal domain-containing protein n=1 Tax=Rhodomicrobium sp. Az07 TaxID=2839034 RepID=UPI001BE4F4AC|nr:glycoside hydrolase family 3 N-terminal domain-containing protein [Rhodomicrobium sp. Az07]MBT3070176.1 hypothetical protein [Rhodomicrobium sp. Az07]
MAHRNIPILRGLALGLALIAAEPCAASGAQEYNGAAVHKEASPEIRRTEDITAQRVKTAQNNGARGDEATAEAQRKLKQELDRLRRPPRDGWAATTPITQPKPQRPVGSTATAQASQKPKAAAPAVAPIEASLPDGPAIDREVDRAAGKVLFLRFYGTTPTDVGAKAMRALLQNGRIAGVMFSPRNIASKAQLRGLVKFLWQGNAAQRPYFAVREIGGGDDALPRLKEFEAWPTPRSIAARGDPEYAYSTYRSLASTLSHLGFNMNFGPSLGPSGAAPDSSSFGANPLQSGVFAKTFILGHKDTNVIPVPVVDQSELSVRALKSLLVAYPGTPVGAAIGAETASLAVYERLVRGPRFCFLTMTAGAADTVSSFAKGCDVLVVDDGKESPAATRAALVAAMADAIRNGTLSLADLQASAQRLSTLRSSAASLSTGFTTRSQ